MTLDPRLTGLRGDLSRDLARVQALCRFVHTDASPFDILAVAKLLEDTDVALMPHASTEGVTVAEGPVVETASLAITVLGYLTDTAGARWTSPGTIIFPAILSAHEQLEAIRLLDRADM